MPVWDREIGAWRGGGKRSERECVCVCMRRRRDGVTKGIRGEAETS